MPQDEVEVTLDVGEFLRVFMRFLEDEGYAKPISWSPDEIVEKFVEKVRAGELGAGS